MKRSLNSLIGFSIHASDGEIGKVKEFYFDDDTWIIRYVIVDTGNWLSGRVVLISTDALNAPDWENRTFPVALTKEQVKNSPDINTELPVSRQEEHKLYAYYPWVAYWGGGYYGGGSGPLSMWGGGTPITTAEEVKLEKDEDKHLRSTDKVKGYTIKANDGHIGDVEDFIIEDVIWKIDFLLVDTGHWFPGKKVLIALDIINEIDWTIGAVRINSSVAQVKESPAYDPSQELTEIYTLNMHDHYHRAGY